jgi:hypothetical protein
MKKLMLIAVISAMAVSMAMADNPCPTGSLGLYMNADGSTNGFTCHIGVLDFSGWSETFSPNPGGINPAQLTVTPDPTTGDQGFMFTAFWTASNLTGNAANNATEDSTINFTVTDTAGALLHDLGLGFNGAFTGTGASHVTEQYCLNGPLSGCPGANSGNIQVTNPPQNFNQNFVFASNATSVSVSKDIGVASGANGTASISQVNNNFSNTPEPRLISLLSMALIAGLGLSKKFKSVIS